MEINRRLAIKKWDEQFGKNVSATDFAGRKIQKGAFGQLTSTFGWTLTYLLPRSVGGTVDPENLICVHVKTAAEKEENFPSFNANDVKYKLTKENGVFTITKSEDADAIAEQEEKKAKAMELWKETFGDVESATDFAGRSVIRQNYGSGRDGAWKVAPYVDTKPTENKNAYIANLFTIAEALGKTAFKSNGRSFTLNKENGIYVFNEADAKPTIMDDSESTFDILEVSIDDETEVVITEQENLIKSPETSVDEVTETTVSSETEVTATEEETATKSSETSIDEVTETTVSSETEVAATEEETATKSPETSVDEVTETTVSNETEVTATEEETSAKSSETSVDEVTETTVSSETEVTATEKENANDTVEKKNDSDVSSPLYVSEKIDRILSEYKRPETATTWLDFIAIHAFCPPGTLPATASALSDSVSSIITEAAGPFIAFDVSELVEEAGSRNMVLTYRFATPGTADMERIFSTAMLLNTYAPLVLKKFGLTKFKIYNSATPFETSLINYPSGLLAEQNQPFKTFMSTVFNSEKFYDGEAPTTLYVSETVVYNIPSLYEIHKDDTNYYTDARLTEHNFVFGDIKKRLDDLIASEM